MRHSDLVLGTGNGGVVIDCQNCGYAHLDPLPNADEIDTLYQDQYYQAHNAGFTHGAHSLHFDEQLEDLAWHEIFFREQLGTLAQLSPEKTMLDYGAGCGLFARYARDATNWSITAVEPSPAAREYATSVVQAEVVEQLPANGRYGAIRACYVLEHLLEPRQALLELGKHLVPGGILCIVVPNEFNAWACAGRDKLGLDSYWIRPGLHLNYFTHESIAALLRDAGYEIVGQLATFPTELFMLSGLDFASDVDLGHRLHHLRMGIELAIDKAGFGTMKLELYRRLAKAGLGRASVTYARKGVG